MVFTFERIIATTPSLGKKAEKQNLKKCLVEALNSNKPREGSETVTKEKKTEAIVIVDEIGE